jgi:hypothetical protein
MRFSAATDSRCKDLRGDQSVGWPEGSGSATDIHKRGHSAPELRDCHW